MTPVTPEAAALSSALLRSQSHNEIVSVDHAGSLKDLLSSLKAIYSGEIDYTDTNDSKVFDVWGFMADMPEGKMDWRLSVTIVEVSPVAGSDFRADGLNNPLSINSGIGCSWDDVENKCEESDAVEGYTTDAGSITIFWCDGDTDTFRDPQAAINAIKCMEYC